MVTLLFLEYICVGRGNSVRYNLVDNNRCIKNWFDRILGGKK